MNSHEIINENQEIKKPLLIHPSKHLGGVKTLPFILGNEGFERAAFFGIQPNLIIYLMGAYGLDMAKGSTIIYLWAAATNLTPIIGAFFADAYLGRFTMIAFGCISALLGTVLLWTTTIIPGVRPLNDHAAPFQLVYLCLSLALMSIGAGGLRSSGLAFGADQLQNTKEDENSKPDSNQALSSLVNWYYFAMTFAMLFAITCIMYIQDNMGWQVGFGVPMSLMLVSTISFFSASSWYVKVKPTASVLARPARVVVAAWRNRGCTIPSHHGTNEYVYHVVEGSVFQAPSDHKLRFLNKACIIKDDNENALNNPCTIDQVEELKSIIKLMALWSTGILLSTNTISQTSFPVLQAKSMDKHVFPFSSFEIPAASVGTFSLVALLLWIALYDRVIIPLASKVMGEPVIISALTRIGAGILVSTIGVILAGFIENVRRGTLISTSENQMSVLWLVPQICLIGLADGFIAMAQIEFFYSEFPKDMSSIASSLHGLCVTTASLISSIILSVVDNVTKQDGKESWVSSDPNKGRYDYFYWVIGSLSLLNFVYFLLCRRAFKNDKRISQEKMTLITSHC